MGVEKKICEKLKQQRVTEKSYIKKKLECTADGDHEKGVKKGN